MKLHRTICLTEMSDQGVRFLAEIRRAGMDILFPQIKHDKVRTALDKGAVAVDIIVNKSAIQLFTRNNYTITSYTLIYHKLICISGFVYHIRSIYASEGDCTQGID